MKERKTKKISVRVTDKDSYILRYLQDKLNLSLHEIIMKAIGERYFPYVKQAEHEYFLRKNE